MNPISFPEVVTVLKKPADMSDEECASLPVWNDGIVCVSCWQMSWRERLLALVHGRIWLWVRSGPTQPPVALEIARPDFPDA